MKLMIAINVLLFVATNAAAIALSGFDVGSVVFAAIWLAVIYGIKIRSRVAWQLVRAASLISAAGAAMGALAAGNKPFVLAYCAALLTLSIACFIATWRTSAREYFNLRCPNCARLTLSVRMLTAFRKAYCGVCSVSW